MNVILHTTTAIAIAVMVTDTRRIGMKTGFSTIAITGIIGFMIGITSHAILDYVPHCYPINSKVDIVTGLLMILGGIFATKKRYRLILLFSFLGCVIPDVIDLSASILNKLFGWHLPVYDHVFPWHWKEFSGSIYGGDCVISSLNHYLLIITILAVLWLRRDDLRNMVGR